MPSAPCRAPPSMSVVDGVAIGWAEIHLGACASGRIGKALTTAPAPDLGSRQRLPSGPRSDELGLSPRAWPRHTLTAPGVWKTGRMVAVDTSHQWQLVEANAPLQAPDRKGRPAVMAPPGLSHPSVQYDPPEPPLVDFTVSDGTGSVVTTKRHPGAQPRVQKGSSNRPAEILVCAESTEDWAGELWKHPGGAGLHGQLRAKDGFNSNLLSVPKFARWMFKQVRGPHIVPWVTLVVGWREAKPCVDAIEAAATGRDCGLRQDASRTLRAATGDTAGSARVKVAVSTVIIAVHNARQKAKADRFIATYSGADATQKTDLKITVACGADELLALAAAALSPAKAADHPPLSAAGGAEPPHPRQARAECGSGQGGLTAMPDGRCRDSLARALLAFPAPAH